MTSKKFSLANLPGLPSETPLSHLTTTNNPPTNEEIRMVHTIVNADNVSIDQIDKILVDLSRLEKMIKDRRVAYANRIYLHKQILKPHRSLTSDVLCEIFQHFLSSMRPYMGLPTAPHRILGAICRGWRNVLVSNPRLWSIIPEIDLNTFQTRQQGFNLSLSTALQLSRSAPLDIDIRYVEPSQFTSHPALAMLLPASDRYQRLSLSIFHTYLPQFASLRGRLSSLRTLTLYVHGRQVNLPNSMDLFDDTPNLQNLIVNGPFPMPICEWLRVPWPQLIRFSGYWVKPTDIVTLLTHATSLEDCTLHCALPPMTLDRNSTVIHHRLAKLRIYPHEGTNRELLSLEVLNRLTLPNLREITIKDIGIQTATLVNLVARSHCVLTFVDLETSIYGDIPTFVNAIPGVQILCITPTPPLMMFLYQDAFPRLRYLMFYSMGIIPVSDIGWVPAARAMQPNVDPLVMFIISKISLRRSHYESLFDQLDLWYGLGAWDMQCPVYKQWIQLIEASNLDEICQDQNQQLVIFFSFLLLLSGE